MLTALEREQKYHYVCSLVEQVTGSGKIRFTAGPGFDEANPIDLANDLIKIIDNIKSGKLEPSNPPSHGQGEDSAMTKQELLSIIESLKGIVDVPWPRSKMGGEDLEEVTLPAWVLENFSEVSKFLRDVETYLINRSN